MRAIQLCASAPIGSRSRAKISGATALNPSWASLRATDLIHGERPKISGAITMRGTSEAEPRCAPAGSATKAGSAAPSLA